MTCQCICHCPNLADDRWEPQLCMACSLCTAIDQSANPKHGLPYTPPAEEKLEPPVHISDAQKDKAIENVVAENGF